MKLITIWRLNLERFLKKGLPLERQVLLDQMRQDEEGFVALALDLDLRILFKGFGSLVVGLENEGF